MNEKELNEAVASLIKEPGDKQALAEMLIEYVQPNHITTDFVGMLLNSRSLKEGDILVKKLRKGIRVHSLVPGTIHLASEVTISDRVNYALDGLDVKVTWNEWEMANGEIGTVDELSTEMGAKLRDAFQNKVFTALSTIWNGTNTPDNYVSVGGSVTPTALMAAIDRINQTTGGVKAVVGSRVAMTPITKFAGFYTDTVSSTTGVSQTFLDQLLREGSLGQYYGAPLVTIEQIYDNPADYNALIPTDKILVIGENVGEFISYGPPKTKSYTDMRPTPPQYFLEMYQRFALMVWNAQGIYVIAGLS